jgi:transcription termination factor Rho
VSVDPFERLRLETTPDIHTTRALDLVTPLGKGQRCLIVSPPKAGKTSLLIDIAKAVDTNHPEVSIFTLLVDERPEEVTNFRRQAPGEVMAASSDLTTVEHIDVAEAGLSRALEKVVAGEDVLVLLDSITRLARAYNATMEGSGRTMSGGLDAATMHTPRQFFGAGRKIEDGGSLTIVGTALIDTGSRMDQVIFEEFKGTGNTELVLSREIFERRIFPCIEISKSGTRKEEKLYPPEQVSQLHAMHKALASMEKSLAMEKLLDLLQRYPTNVEALAAIGAALA